MQALSSTYSVWLELIDSFCGLLLREGEEDEDSLRLILNRAISVAESGLREEPLKIITSLLQMRYSICTCTGLSRYSLL